MPFDEKLLDRLEQILASPRSRGPYSELEREVGGSNAMGRLQYALAKRQDQQRQQKLEARLRANGGNYGSGGYRRSKTQRRRSQRRQRRQSRRN